MVDLRAADQFVICLRDGLKLLGVKRSQPGRGGVGAGPLRVAGAGDRSASPAARLRDPADRATGEADVLIKCDRTLYHKRRDSAGWPSPCFVSVTMTKEHLGGLAFWTRGHVWPWLWSWRKRQR